MKVLFLDIDGVLNCVTTPGSCSQKLDPVMVARLNRVITKTCPIVILSSSWGLAQGRTEQALRQAGFIGHLHGETPNLWPSRSEATDVVPAKTRGDEIAAWLEEWPDIDAFAIVDDGADMGELLPHLVQTSWETGLQDAHVDELIRRLS